jgi:hypothetical protein
MLKAAYRMYGSGHVINTYYSLENRRLIKVKSLANNGEPLGADASSMGMP